MDKPEMSSFQDGVMAYRRLGKSDIQVSVIGFGTCQLRLTPEKQAMDTLMKGFDLGVNIVHTAPDYGNAEDIVARAVRESDKEIIVASQGYDIPGNAMGPVSHFEQLFEATCERLRTERLHLYGIACIDDREVHRENVWGKKGMVEFLLKMKEQGRLSGIFCTTHGVPDYVKQLVTCGVFDAVMVAYNILGYHLLSCNPPPDRHFESLPRIQEEIFPLCRAHDVGLMIMKPLGGGLLCESQAFPPYRDTKDVLRHTNASDVLRAVLQYPEVTCVLPGTASVAEAEMNALSGHGPIALGEGQQEHLTKVVERLRSTVCSRCGTCDSLCSQGLPVSWIFRAGLVNLYPAAVFEQPENIEYFRLHPKLEAACAACRNVTCTCPEGIDIPKRLKDIHSSMLRLMRRGLIPPPDTRKGRIYGDRGFGARIVSMDIPRKMAPGETCLCRLLIENAGDRGWLPDHREHQARVLLGVFVQERRVQAIEVTQDVHKGGRWHFVFEITAPARRNRFHLRLQLLGEHQQFSEKEGPVLFSETIAVIGRTSRWNGVLEREATALGLERHVRSVGRAAGRLAERARYGVISRLKVFCSTNRLLKGLRSAPASGNGQDVNIQANRGSRQGPVDGSHIATSGPMVDSQPYDLAWIENNLPASYPKGEPFQLYLRVENRGSRHWHASHPEGNWVELVVYIGDALHCTARIPHDVPPGEGVVLTARLTFPNTAEGGKWRITLSFVEQNVAWFHQSGASPLVTNIRAEEPETGPVAEAAAIARGSNWGLWQPSQGITRSRTGCRYPMFIEHVRGCRVRDAERNEWIDYVMAGGAAILGYAYPEIQDAVSRQLGSSAVTTLPHMLEIEATKLLCDMIPCAEMALFGKHGSDMCTVAVRTARLHTGRKKILFSGYHGWHDWYAETLQPKLKVPSGEATLFRFDLNDPSSFRALVKAHSGEIAGVILEPAAQAASLDGPVCEADPGFLREVVDTCRQEGIILIFDEIVTGFRYPGGSVQQATGIIPDLTCLGKALSAGMPLSALVGRREVMQTSVQAAYMPTFRGETYSLAAAVAALKIYRRRDVPGEIHGFGTALKDAVNRVSRELSMQGEMIGVPFRMIYIFHEADALKKSMKRTLLLQELLQRGIVTYQGYMLPSTAHGDTEMEQTVCAFKEALQRVQEISSESSFVRYLDIPLI